MILGRRSPIGRRFRRCVQYLKLSRLQNARLGGESHGLKRKRASFSALSFSSMTSPIGTFETCRGGLTMSVDWDRAEVTFQGRGDRFYPARKSAFTQPLKVAPWPPAPQPSECQRKITFVLGFQSRCANVWPVGSTSPRRNSTRGSHDQSGPAHCWLPLVAAR